MLDSMYPELSAQARTLSILRGNVSLGNRNTCTAGGGSGSEPSTPPTLTNGNSGVPTVTPSSHFNSVATAFTKTQQTGKRAGTNAPLPKSAKKLRLGGSPVTIGTRPPSDLAVAPLPDSGEAKVPQPVRAVNGLHVVKKDTVAQVEEGANGKEGVISEVLAKLASSCFDLLPVVRSHVFIKRISSVPILTEEEKAVVNDFCTKHKVGDSHHFFLLFCFKIGKTYTYYVYVCICLWIVKLVSICLSFLPCVTSVTTCLSDLCPSSLYLCSSCPPSWLN